MPIDVLQIARQDDSAWRVIAEFCDMNVRRRTEPWFRLSSDRPFTVFATDSTGGTFAQVAGTPPEASVFYVSSEGQAGFIAADVQSLFELLVAMPYWAECLKYSSNGDIVEARKAAGYLEKMLRRKFPDAEQRRAYVRNLLALRAPESPLDELWSCLKVPDRILSETDGWANEALFGTWSSDVVAKWGEGT